MPIPTSFTDLSTTPSSNSPAGSESPTDGDGYLRTIFAMLRSIMSNSGNGWTSPYLATASNPSSTYTPTLTNSTNVTASTAQPAQYIRIGNIVVVHGSITAVSCTSHLSDLSEIGVSLPIASNLAAVTDLNGTGGIYWEANSNAVPVQIIGDTTNDRATFRFPAEGSNTSTRRLTYTFSYSVI